MLVVVGVVGTLIKIRFVPGCAIRGKNSSTDSTKARTQAKLGRASHYFKAPPSTKQTQTEISRKFILRDQHEVTINPHRLSKKLEVRCGPIVGTTQLLGTRGAVLQDSAETVLRFSNHILFFFFLLKVSAARKENLPMV